MICDCTKDTHPIYHFESGCWCTKCIDDTMKARGELGDLAGRLVVAAKAVVTRNSSGIYRPERDELRDAADAVSMQLTTMGYVAP